MTETKPDCSQSVHWQWSHIISPAIQTGCIAKRIMAVVLGIMLVFNQSSFVFAQAQVVPSALDIDPPVIDHESLETGVAGQLQLFSALVVDDRGIDYVHFHYRSVTNSDYQKVPMARVAGTANFAASIETELGQSKIEYYIEAGDTGGNRVLKGFPFFPLVRNLEMAPTAITSTSAGAGNDASGGGDSKWLYVALGALTVGLLVSASSSGGDSTPVDPGEEVPLTINISSPLN